MVASTANESQEVSCGCGEHTSGLARSASFRAALPWYKCQVIAVIIVG